MIKTYSILINTALNRFGPTFEPEKRLDREEPRRNIGGRADVRRIQEDMHELGGGVEESEHRQQRIHLHKKVLRLEGWDVLWEYFNLPTAKGKNYLLNPVEGGHCNLSLIMKKDGGIFGE